MSQRHQMFIDGQWVDSTSGEWYEDLNPYTGEPFAIVASGGAQDAKLALDAAAKTFPSWAAAAPSDRRRVLLKAADLLEDQQEEIASLLTKETGSIRKWAGFQISRSIGTLREAASHVHRVTGEVLPSDEPGRFSMVLRQPVG